MRKIIIIGAGFYGCVVAWTLHTKKIPFQIIDIENDFFTKSSKWNQYRLHTGVHYPRSKQTQEECIRGHQKFKEYFPDFITPVLSYYMFHPDSTINPETFTLNKHCQDQLQFKITHNDFPFTTTIKAPILQTNEYVIDCFRLADFFTTCLSQYMIPHYDISNDDNSIIIDCTYGSLFPHKDFIEESCTMFVYSSPNESLRDLGITVMDGNYFSIFPSPQKGNWTLSHVYWSKNVNLLEINQVRKQIENHVNQIFPNLFQKLNLTYQYHFTSRKVKPKISPDDDRNVFVYYPKENVISVMGGKLTGIFDAIPIVLNFIKNELHDKDYHKLIHFQEYLLKQSTLHQ